jgi:lipoprotein NlpI
MFPGECVFQLSVKCPDCREDMPLAVLNSPAGFYLGHYCLHCGPFDRCTTYFKLKAVADKELENIKKNGFAASTYVRS